MATAFLFVGARDGREQPRTYPIMTGAKPHVVRV
jgi:hypothetical protein